MRRADEAGGGSIIVPSQDGSGFHIVRKLLEPLYRNPIGYIKIDMAPTYLDEILKNINFTPNSRLYILNNKSETIYPNSGEVIPQNVQGTVFLEGKEYIGRTTTSNQGSIQFITLISVEDLRKDTFSLLSNAVLIWIVALIIALLLPEIKLLLFLLIFYVHFLRLFGRLWQTDGNKSRRFSKIPLFPVLVLKTIRIIRHS